MSLSFFHDIIFGSKSKDDNKTSVTQKEVDTTASKEVLPRTLSPLPVLIDETDIVQLQHDIVQLQQLQPEMKLPSLQIMEHSISNIAILPPTEPIAPSTLLLTEKHLPTMLPLTEPVSTAGPQGRRITSLLVDTPLPVWSAPVVNETKSTSSFNYYTGNTGPTGTCCKDEINHNNNNISWDDTYMLSSIHSGAHYSQICPNMIDPGRQQIICNTHLPCGCPDIQTGGYETINNNNNVKVDEGKVNTTSIRNSLLMFLTDSNSKKDESTLENVNLVIDMLDDLTKPKLKRELIPKSNSSVSLSTSNNNQWSLSPTSLQKLNQSLNDMNKRSGLSRDDSVIIGSKRGSVGEQDEIDRLYNLFVKRLVQDDQTLSLLYNQFKQKSQKSQIQCNSKSNESKLDIINNNSVTTVCSNVTEPTINNISSETVKVDSGDNKNELPAINNISSETVKVESGDNNGVLITQLQNKLRHKDLLFSRLKEKMNAREQHWKGVRVSLETTIKDLQNEIETNQRKIKTLSQQHVASHHLKSQQRITRSKNKHNKITQDNDENDQEDTSN